MLKRRLVERAVFAADTINTCTLLLRAINDGHWLPPSLPAIRGELEQIRSSLKERVRSGVITTPPDITRRVRELRRARDAARKA